MLVFDWMWEGGVQIENILGYIFVCGWKYDDFMVLYF